MSGTSWLSSASVIARSRGAAVAYLAIGLIVANQVSLGQRPEKDKSVKLGAGKAQTTAPKDKAETTANPGGSAPMISPPTHLADAGSFGGGSGRLQGGGQINFSGGGFTGVHRFTFKFDSKTPLQALLPPPPVVKPPQPSWLLTDLTQTPQVFFQKPAIVKPAVPSAATGGDKAAATTSSGRKRPMTASEKQAQKELEERQARRRAAELDVAHTLAKIDYLNGTERDRFVKLLIEHRPDLAGLPFIMGDACRMSKGVCRQFIQEVRQVKPFGGFSGGAAGSGFSGGGFSGVMAMQPAPDPKKTPAPTADEVARAKVAALMQILGPAPAAQQKELVKKLTDIDHAESTRALARIAVFSFEKDVCAAALSAPTRRAGDPVTPVLLHGLRYPWPAVAQNAADAIVYLRRLDLAPEMIDVLDEPDPRAPFVPEGECVPVVREVVRLNHHHNCITCHAPATSDPDFKKTGATSAFLVAAPSIPVPDPLQNSLPFGGYNSFGPSLSPDLMLRIDVTYLRQDFSLMQKAESLEFGAGPQRFDYLVRTREVTPQEMHDYAKWAARQGHGFIPPNQRAAWIALRQLTNRNVEAKSAAWRKALGI